MGFMQARSEYQKEVTDNPGGTFFDPISKETKRLADIDLISWHYEENWWNADTNDDYYSMADAEVWCLFMKDSTVLYYSDIMPTIRSKYHDETFRPLVDTVFPD